MADNERNIRAEAGKDASKLHSDVASPNHSHTLRKVVQLEEPVTGDCVLASCRVQHGRAMNELSSHHIDTDTGTDRHIHTHIHTCTHAHSPRPKVRTRHIRNGGVSTRRQHHMRCLHSTPHVSRA